VTTGTGAYTWIIDPLDGTTNFLHGIPQFAVSIAIMHEGVVEHGVVYDPIKDELFYASLGAGAFLNQRRIRTSEQNRLHGALLGTGFPRGDITHLKDYLRLFEILTPEVAGIRRAGAATLDLAYVACGRFDGFWEFGLSPWDIAAGALLIQEAGGIVSDFHGKDNMIKSGHIVAGTPRVHQGLQALTHKFFPNLI
jgi:myo-inositol-1(or 4)-monophosphatase